MPEKKHSAKIVISLTYGSARQDLPLPRSVSNRCRGRRLAADLAGHYNRLHGCAHSDIKPAGHCERPLNRPIPTPLGHVRRCAVVQSVRSEEREKVSHDRCNNIAGSWVPHHCSWRLFSAASRGVFVDRGRNGSLMFSSP
jgi:hypothetical protein